MSNIDTLLNFVIFYQTFAYIILFLGMIFEGEIILLFAGILLHLGAINLIPTIILASAGLVSKSFIAFNLGSFIQRKFPNSRFIKYIDKKIDYFLPDFQEKPFWSIFISKFLVGLNNFTLIFSGYLKLKFRTYIKAEIFSNILWLSLILSLGYFFSYTAISITKEVKKFTVLVILFIFAFIILEKIVTFVYEIFEEFYRKHIRNSEGSK